ncbi:MAG: site-2 protease family protein [Phycisphaerales bacterium]
MGFLTTVGDLALVVLGFSLIIFLHELGHFAAARWAKVRVLAFAMGFGPAVASYRKGMGWRSGSSEKEYQKLLKEEARGGRVWVGLAREARGRTRVGPTGSAPPSIGSTCCRWAGT